MKNILIVESGDIDFRGYILKSIAEADYNIFLIKNEKPEWEIEYIQDYIIADLSNYEQVLSKVNEMVVHHSFAGIFTYIETYVELTSYLSQALNLRFPLISVSEKCRDKHLMRKTLLENGLKVPKFSQYKNTQDILENFNFPFVVKPIKGYSSINVVKVECYDQLLQVEKMINLQDDEWNVGSKYLVEEYIGGSEYSVESVVVNGDVYNITITDKFKGPEPYFEEVGHTVPSSVNKNIHERVLQATTKGIIALGIDNCSVHTEIRLNNNEPVIIEIGARLAGDKIPYLIQNSLNIDMAKLAADASVGQPFQSLHKNAKNYKYTTIMFFCPFEEQTIKKELNSFPDFNSIIEFRYWGEAAEIVAPPPKQFFTRLGYVIVSGETYKQSQLNAEEVTKWLSKQIGVELLTLRS